VRILLTSHYAPPHIGGIEAVVSALGRELIRRGHDVRLVTSDARSPGLEGTKEPWTVEVPAWNWPERKLDVPWPVFSPALARVLRREVARADVVHSHGALYMPTLGALPYARRLGGRARILTEHVGHVHYESPVLDAVQRAAFASAGRAAVRAAQAVVVLNDKVEAEMRALAGGRPVVRSLNGIDTDAYRPAAPGEREALRADLGWHDDRPRVVFVGRLVAKKGVDVAFEAARAAGDAFELVLVGPGQVGAPPGVSVLGPRKPADVARILRAADAFLLPSRGEGFPVTAQEAMASGLPVVLSDDPSYGPWVDGSGATLVEPRADTVVAALRALLADPDARARAGQMAAEHARRRFSWERVADEHERLYERMLSAAQG
jgi:glycosyltransferase involved in cell wall biosynthesis